MSVSVRSLISTKGQSAVTATALSSTGWIAEWQRWRHRRLAEVRAEHGIAALSHAAWLDDQSQPVPGLPGVWSRRGDEAYGQDGTQSYVIGIGQSQRFGPVVARVAAWRSQLTLRVFDPAAPTRTGLRDIGTFPPDEGWRFEGRFEAAVTGVTASIEHHGVGLSNDDVAGVVRLTIDRHEVALLVLPTPEGTLRASFADQTNGDSTAQFRFLPIDRPTADEPVLVDFNRAHLPPCAFSDHYLCPLPPAQNRLAFPVTAGETFLVSCQSSVTGQVLVP